MKQLSLATAGFERYARTTRRAAFLAKMDRVVPWSALCGLIEPYSPKPGNGRPPAGVERMPITASDGCGAFLMWCSISSLPTASRRANYLLSARH